MRSLTAGIPNGRVLPSPLGISTRRIGCRSVFSALKPSLKFFQIDFRSGRKLLHALPIHSSRSGVVFHFAPGRPKHPLAVHLVDQAKPFPSFNAVFQRRQHALAPHRGFYPRPVSALDFCALSSPRGHSRRFAFALPRYLAHASTFLPPVPRRCFASSASRGSSPLRYHEGSDSCTAHLRRRSPRLPRHTFLSFRLQPRGLPGHRLPPRQRDQRVSDFALESQARRSSPPNRVRSSYGPTVRLRLLSTPLHSDAVTLGYGAVAYSDTDFHRADVAPSRAHDSRLMHAGMTDFGKDKKGFQ